MSATNLEGIQKVFNEVSAHLLQQKKRCVDALTGECLYRGSDGTKCAVGCLIPDELYDKELENSSIRSILNETQTSDRKQKISAHFTKTYGDVPLDFYSRLQAIHDRTSSCDWRLRLQGFGTHWNLDVSSVESDQNAN